MAILLEEMKVGMSDKIAEQVIDTFIRESEVLELLPFDNAVSPSGGSTMTYGYIQKKLPSTTAFRALNSEYGANQATVEKKSVDLKIFGGAFEIDRVIKSIEGKYNNMAMQIEEKIKSAVGTFHNGMINGDSASNASSFDGLDKFLVGQSTEFNTDSVIDLSTIELLKKNADEFYEALLKLINRTGAHALLVNEGMKTKIQTVARVLGYKTEAEEAFGRTVTTVGENKVRLIDLKNTLTVSDDASVETPIIAVKNRTVGGGAKTGITDIYAVRFNAENGFTGVTLTGNGVVGTYLPDFTAPGAVKKGEVEMVSIIPEIKAIEVDGASVQVKGLTQKFGETGKLEANLIEVTPDMLKMSIVGKSATSDIDGYDLIMTKPLIEDADYADNIAYVGYKADDTPVIIIMENALCTSGLEIEGKNKDNAVIKITFECYAGFDSSMDVLPIKIYTPSLVQAQTLANKEVLK